MAEATPMHLVLLDLAAEGIAPLVPGCANILASASTRAIDLFGPGIVQRWWEQLGTRTPAEQLEVLVQLAGLSFAEGRRQAAAGLERVAASVRPEDKGLALEYLAAIPLAVRRTLVPDPETGKMGVPAALASDLDRLYNRVLPVDVPPFSIGSELPGTTYRLEELMGIGGFGAVYKASNRFEQHQPPRAIKFCLDAALVPTLHHERSLLDRMMAVERSAWSERIVRLYGYALDAKPPFLVYEFVPGGDLISHVTALKRTTGRGYPPEQALELIRQIAEALAFAHELGLVHRDLKPANVLVSNATVKLTDFGIGGVMATHAVRGSGPGSAPDPVDQAAPFRGSGTPLYMSPEQRRGDQPDPRHDLYSLGVLWYQLLLGDVTRELHPGWLDELAEEVAVPSEQLELIERCVGYFKKRPADAGELLAMLPRRRGKGEGGRGKGKESELQAPVAVAGPSKDSSSPFPLPPSPSTPVGNVKEKKFEKLRRTLAAQLNRDAFHEARDTVAAMLRLKPGDPDTLDARDLIRSRLGKENSSLAQHTFQGHEGWVRSVAFSPEEHRAISSGDDGTIRLWDLAAATQIRCFQGHEAPVMSVAFLPEGAWLLSGSWDGTVRLWDVDSGEQLRVLQGRWQAVKCVAASPDNQHALFAADDHRLHIWDLESAQEVLVLEGHTDQIQSVAFSPDGFHALSGGDDGTLRLWDLDEAGEIRCFPCHADAVTSVAFAPSGRWLLSGSSDATARILDPNSGKELRSFTGPGTWINAVACAPNNRRILTGSGGEISDGQFRDGADKTVRLWDVATGQEIACFEGHLASVTSVAFSPDGRLALSGSLDQTVRLWDLPE